MTNTQTIQPEAFEFEPEFSSGEFEAEFDELESEFGEYEYEGEYEFKSAPAEFEADEFGEFETDQPGEFEQECRFVRRRKRPRPRIWPMRRTSSTQPTFDAPSFREKLANLARQELARWEYGKIKESHPTNLAVLQDYWMTGAGLGASDSQSAIRSRTPWSAAFISWLMRKAGAGDAFAYNPGHAVYTRAAIDNRLANNNNPFKAYRTSELAPQPGDLICASRAGSGANYDNVKYGMPTHCDVVIGVQPGKIFAVGGNVSDSVKQKVVPTNADGRIAAPDFFAVIRAGVTRPAVAGRSELEREFSFNEFETEIADGESAFKAFEFEVPVGQKPSRPTVPLPALSCPPKMAEIKCPPAGPRPTAIIDDFEFDRTVIKPGCQTLLINEIARRIIQSHRSRQPICSLLLVGHTDPVGNAKYNEALGRRRARAVADAVCARLMSLKPKLACPIQFRCASCGEQQVKSTPQLSRRVEVFLPAPPAPRGCAPFKERIRLHLKILVQPAHISIETMIASMRQLYEPAGFLIEIVSCEMLKAPTLEELSLRPDRRFPCPTANLTADQVALFKNRNNADANDIAIYFLRQTLPGTRGTCVHPVGLPGVVVTSRASQWTLAHEVGHVLGLRHVAITDRLMFRNTGRITNLPPDLIASEIATMGASALTLPC